MTLRELSDMAWARQAAEWDRSCVIAATIANQWRKQGARIDPMKINPYRRGRRRTPKMKPSELAKLMAPGGKKHGQRKDKVDVLRPGDGRKASESRED